MFGDDGGLKFMVVEIFVRSFVIVEFLNEFVKFKFGESFVGDLGVVFG